MEINKKQSTSAASFLDLFKGNKMVTINRGHSFSDFDYDNIYTASTLTAENNSKAHIYFVPNELKNNDRHDSEVFRARAIFIDDDGPEDGVTDPTKFPIPPNITVQSSPGKWHYYWLTSTMEIDEWRAVQTGAIIKFHGDPKCKNPARIMRLPGFINQKESYNGFVTEYEIHSDKPYSWKEIKEAFPPADATVEVADFSDNEYPGDAELLRRIQQGEDIHGSRVSFSMHHASNSTMPYETCLATVDMMLKMALDLGNITKARYDERKGNMVATIKSAYTKVQSEVGVAIIDTKPVDDKYTRLPRPPGKLALIADEIMKYANYPSWEMSMFTAQALVATFGGGLYSYENKPTNRKWTNLANTGRGKAVCGNFVDEVFRRVAMFGSIDAYAFKGNNAYAPGFIHGELLEHRVRLWMTTEAGLMAKGSAGSVEELRAYKLDLVTASIRKVTSVTQVSARTAEGKKANESLKPIYGAVGVFLSESVPGQYIEALKQNHAFESGDVGREEIAFVDPQIPEMNKNPEGAICDSVIEMFFKLAQKFEKTGRTNGDDLSNADRFTKIDVTAVEDLVRDYIEKIRVFRNEKIAENDYVGEAMWSRVGEKIMITILLQAICDASYKCELRKPRATADMFHYAVKYHEELIRSLIAQAHTGVLADNKSLCVDKVSRACQDYGTGKTDYRDKKHSVSPKVIRRGWFKDVLDRGNFGPFKSLMKDHRGDSDRVIRMLVSDLVDMNILIEIKKNQWKINL